MPTIPRTPLLERFAGLVRAYRRTLFADPREERSAARAARRLLATLYREGTLLEDAPIPNRTAPGRDEGTTREDRHRAERCSEGLAYNYYTAARPPLENPDAPGTDAAALSAALDEIWSELGPGLELYDAREFEPALQHWRRGFARGWGRQVLATLSLLHRILDRRSPP